MWYFSLNQIHITIAKSCLMGLLMFQTWMIGHDAMHNSILPWTGANHFLTMLTMDGLIVNSITWRTTHHKEHHSYPHTNVDGQRLTGNTIFSEIWLVFMELMR